MPLRRAAQQPQRRAGYGERALQERSASLHVSDLPPDVNESALFDLFRKVGPIYQVRIGRDAGGRPLGYAHVNYQCEQDAVYAHNTMQGQRIQGKRCCISFARNPAERPFSVDELHPCGERCPTGRSCQFRFTPREACLLALDGGCAAGSACPNRHARPRDLHPCEHQNSGGCISGDHCAFRYAHASICTHYLKGQCRYRGRCKHEHPDDGGPLPWDLRARSAAGGDSGGGGGRTPGGVGMFLKPAACTLPGAPPRGRFASCERYLDWLRESVLAEYWAWFEAAQAAPAGRVRLGGPDGHTGRRPVLSSPPEHLSQSLASIDGHRGTYVLFVGFRSRIGDVNTMPRIGDRGGWATVLGNIAHFISEHQAVTKLKVGLPKTETPLLRAAADPTRAPAVGSWRRVEPDGQAVLARLNPSQRAAVKGLRDCLEVIHGPPGTGKSTTIAAVVSTRIPEGERVLVTCTRNAAVDSLAAKLSTPGRKLVAFGTEAKMGAAARHALLDEQVNRDPGVVYMRTIRSGLQRGVAALGSAVQQKLRDWARPMQAWLRYKYRGQLTALHLSKQGLMRVEAFTESLEEAVRARILREAQVVLATCAHLPRLLNEYDERCGEPLGAHTVIVDEAGCTADTTAALFFACSPRNLLLVGDHKQLPPHSHVAAAGLEADTPTAVSRSLLERLVDGGGCAVHLLATQYRMHPRFSRVVSELFYEGRVGDGVTEAERECAAPLVWIDVPPESGAEERDSQSWCREAECAAALAHCGEALKADPGGTVAILSLYRAQHAMMERLLPQDFRSQVSVLTVDACQGSEYDRVIVLTSRCNAERRVGFCSDAQRACVAMSRARKQLAVVGCYNTLSACRLWQRLGAAAERRQARFWSVPARGSAAQPPPPPPPPPPEAPSRAAWAQGAARAPAAGRGKCRFWNGSGGCNSGASCPFAHPPAAGRGAGRGKGAAGGAGQPRCRHYDAGNCTFGSTCKYRHG
eukprot:TRINITY_DN1215_c0_g2_i1.p1 TRINITY_DN1215_c0_g2~~TRINITY_DN1215_c0_g2_i1.p1  ORF type:complete len:1002 (+),score=239.53 TRINITY_DN1215_c0_g2_i1:76-3006(+)